MRTSKIAIGVSCVCVCGVLVAANFIKSRFASTAIQMLAKVLWIKNIHKDNRGVSVLIERNSYGFSLRAAAISDAQVVDMRVP